MTAVITVDIAAISFIQNFMQYPSFKFISTYTRNYWGSSMWISLRKDQLVIRYLRSSENMGVQ
jgi:hypothetical protein